MLERAEGKDMLTSNLGGHQPSEEEAEQGMIPHGNNENAFPIQGSGVPMVILTSRHILNKLASLQRSGNMGVEPGLIPPSNLINHIPFARRLFS